MERIGQEVESQQLRPGVTVVFLDTYDVLNAVNSGNEVEVSQTIKFVNS